MAFFKIVAKDLAIDLGTANTLVYEKGKGIIVNEPSVVAMNAESGEVIAIGEEAKEMLGRTPTEIIAIKPLDDGVIADFDITQAMLQYFIKKASPDFTLLQPRVVISVPSGVTDVERRAVEDAALHAGARDAFLVEESLAAAVGSNLPVERAMGNMVLNMGAGTTEVAVVSLNGIVTSRSVDVGGDMLDRAIVEHIKDKYALMIGLTTAEQIKIEIGSLRLGDQSNRLEISGRDMVSGMPVKRHITTKDVTEAILSIVQRVVDAIRQTLETTPPELAADIVNNRILLTGGSAQLVGLDELIEKEIGIGVTLSEHPQESTALGVGKLLDRLDSLRNYRK